MLDFHNNDCRNMPVKALFALLLATAASYPIGADAGTDPECSLAVIQALASSDTRITAVERHQLPVPHCRIEGYVATTDPGPNKVSFALHLPAKEKWNNRYYFANQGGSGGSVPTEAQHPAGNPLVAGFAWAGTDKGHSSAGDVGVSGNWEKDPAKRLDNAHRGAHVVTVAAQKITRDYYGADTMYRYAGGCSGGGGMGQAAAQLHPTDYDGILMGGMPIGEPPDPDRRRQFEQAIFVQESLREPGAWLSPAKRAFAARKVLAACDASDGAEDGVIWDQRLCSFDFRDLQCPAEDSPECLTQPEITSLENILKASYAPISAIDHWDYLGVIPPSQWNDASGTDAFAYTLTKGWIATHLGQPDRDLWKAPLTRDEMWKIMVSRAQASGQGPYGKVGWEAYEKAGGKLIYFTGEADPCCSVIMNEQYFRDTWQQMGKERTDRFAKLYVVPGWGHCGGSNGPADADDRLFQALIEWVEQGKEPKEIITGRGAPEKTRFSFMDFEERRTNPRLEKRGINPPIRDFLLCPFPLVSFFDQDKKNIPGAVYDAENWSCVTREERQALAP